MAAFTLFIIGSCASGQTVLVKPYIQPGNGATLTGSDVKVLTWLTDQKPGSFSVEYGWTGIHALKTAFPQRVQMDFEKAKPKAKKKDDKSKGAGSGDKKDPPGKDDKKPDGKKPDEKKPDEKEDEEPATTLEELRDMVLETFAPIVEREQHYYRYRAELTGLPFDSVVGWRVKLGNTIVREGTAKTRATATKPIRFVAIGDMASNKPEQRSMAYQMAVARPDFVVALGDIVYAGGRAVQYVNHFFPCYNDVPVAGPKVGAAIAAAIPIYPVIGNHDVDMQKFPEYPDAYACYYWFSVPKNGPGVGPWNTPLGKDQKLAAAFRTIAGNEYPAMGHYSFDYGPAHFLVVDANSYSMREYEKFLPWIERDLTSSKQRWKFVCFHQPAFHTSKEHYTEQRMRFLEPAFERAGVDVVFAGHVHNYQRSKPLKFAPGPEGRDKKGRINGKFTLDEKFDGATDTTPEGIIHIVTGGGGAKLYSVNLDKTIEGLKKENGDNYVPLTAKYIADKHSFTLVELTPDKFELRQINIDGKEVDHIKITK